MKTQKATSQKIRRVMLMTIVLLVSLIVTGCSVRLLDPKRVKSQEELGSVHVTVFPPLNFEDYRAGLQPAFDLTPKDALDEVVPITMYHRRAQYRSTGLSASVSLPTATSESTATKEIQDGQITQTQTTQTTKKSGTIESPKDLDPTKQALTAITLPGENKEFKIDPFLKYWTANALYQEVQLLNNFIKGVDFGGQYSAYIVRIQISMIPFLRNAPYDAYVDMTFFLGSEENQVDLKNTPMIMPMLVTDTLESQLNQLSVEEVKQLALALQGMVKGVGLSINHQDYSQLIQSVLGRDYNSLLTVGRLSDNTLRVRLGAIQQATSAYAVIPRTHTVSLVILEPIDGNSKNSYLWMTSKCKFRDSQSGKQLKSKYSRAYSNSNDLKRQFNNVLKSYNSPKIDANKFATLRNAFSFGDREKFGKEIYPEIQRDSKDITEKVYSEIFTKKIIQQLKNIAEKKDPKKRSELFKKQLDRNIEDMKSKIEQTRMEEFDNALKTIFNETKRENLLEVMKNDGCEQQIKNAICPYIEQAIKQAEERTETSEKRSFDMSTKSVWPNAGAPGFESSKQNINEKKIIVTMLWNEMAGLLSKSPLDLTKVYLPKPKRNAIKIDSAGYVPLKEKFMLVDNGKESTLNIRHLGKPAISRLSALLNVWRKKGYKGDPNFIGDPNFLDATLMSSSMKTDSSGSGLIITFPSLKQLGLNTGNPAFTVNLFWLNERGLKEKEWKFSEKIKYILTKPDPAKKRISLAPGYQRIVVGENLPGHIVLIFENIDSDKYSLVISDTSVKSIIPEKDVLEQKKITSDLRKYKILKNGMVTINFDNLKVGDEVKLHGEIDGKKIDPYTVKVVNQSSQKSEQQKSEQ